MLQRKLVFAAFALVQIDDRRPFRQLLLIDVLTGIVVDNAVLQLQVYILGIRHGGKSSTVHGSVVLEDAVPEFYGGWIVNLVHTAYQGTATVWHIGFAGSVCMGKYIAVDSNIGSCLDANQMVKTIAELGTIYIAVYLGAI